MSDLVFPSLPGLDIAVERTHEYDTTVHSTASGKEYRTAWATTPIYSYRLKFNVVREDVSAPAPNGGTSEVGVLLAWLDTHKGRFDSFLYVDPYDGTQRRVRFDDDGMGIRQIADNMWECSLGLRSVR